VLPGIAAKAAEWLGADVFTHWDGVRTPLLAQPLGKYPQLAARVDPAIVRQLVATPATAAQAASNPSPPGKPVISIDDFAKLDLRAAKVLQASRVEGSDKLLQLTLDLGSEQRNVFSGISSSYKSEDLVGRYVVVIANLAPRKMRFGVSEGMVLCASGAKDGGAEGVFLLSADAGVTPGMKIS
jgi:methionyl-tRNA synthetase